MKILLLTIIAFTLYSKAEAKVPRSILPKKIEIELAELSTRFDSILEKECSSNCYSKGCTYGDHKVVKEQDSRLPGLNFSDKSSTSLDYQYYLTKAVCSYAYEDSLSKDQVKQLNQRLKTKLSDGSLSVTVKSKALSEALESEESLIPEETSSKVTEAVISVLPYVIVLLTALLTTILFIWALRRVGKESLAEKMKMF